MHCPYCARSLPDDAAFCYSCGARIESVRPARGVAAGATLAGVGGPVLGTGPHATFGGAAAGLDVRQNTLMSPGGVPGFVPGTNGGAASGLGGSPYPPGAEPTPIGPSLVARRDAPGPLAGLDVPVDRATGPYDLGGAAAGGASGRIAYADLAAARVAVQSGPPVSGNTLPGAWGGTGTGTGTATPGAPATHRNLGAARDSILEERARARQRDVDYGHAVDRENVADFERAIADAEEDPGTELVRRSDNARNVALVAAAAFLAIGLAVGGYLMGRAGRDGAGDEPEDVAAAPDEHEPDRHDATGAPAPATDEPSALAPATDAPSSAAAAPDATAEPAGRPRGPGHAASSYKPKPFPLVPPLPPGGAGAPPVAATAAPAPPATAATAPAPDTGEPAHGDLDSYAPYAGADKDHTPGADDSGVDEVGIAMVVRHHLPKVRACLERRLKTSPTLSGRVEVQFTIAEDGTVPSAFVTRDTVGDPTVGECIVGEMKTWRFPRPADGAVNLIYPFVFPPRT